MENDNIVVALDENGRKVVVINKILFLERKTFHGMRLKTI